MNYWNIETFLLIKIFIFYYLDAIIHIIFESFDSVLITDYSIIQLKVLWKDAFTRESDVGIKDLTKHIALLHVLQISGSSPRYCFCRSCQFELLWIPFIMPSKLFVIFLYLFRFYSACYYSIMTDNVKIVRWYMPN